MKNLILLLSFIIHAGISFSQSCYKTISSQKLCVSKGATISTLDNAKLSNYNFISSKKVDCYSVRKISENGKVSYAVSNGGSELSLSDLNYPDLVSSICNKANARSRSDIYLDMSGFTADEHHALVASCDNRLKSTNNMSQRIISNDSKITEGLKDDFFLNKSGKVKFLEEGELKTEIIKNTTFYSKIVSFTIGIKNYIIKFYSQTKQITIDFISSLAGKLRLIKTAPASLADVISSVKSDIIKKHKISSQDFFTEMTDEFGGSMIVDRLTSRTDYRV